MTEILAFDPGKVTGMAVGTFDHDTPLTLVDTLALPYEELLDVFYENMLNVETDIVVSERFDLSMGNEFAADLHAVKVEGILEFIFGGFRIHYRPRTDKQQVPDELLKELGWWKTGEDVGWEDGRDVNDAMIHMLGYVAFDLEHLPTLKAYFR